MTGSYPEVSQIINYLDRGIRSEVEQAHANQATARLISTLLDDIHRIADALEHIAAKK